MRLKIFLTTAILALSICATSFASPTLAKDDTGEDVLTLQKKLYLIGFTITEFDGVFGDETEKAVLAFQESQNITVTGIVSNATWRALKDAKPVKGRSLNDIQETPMYNKTNTISNYSSAAYGKTFMDGDKGYAIIEIGKKYIGVPYVFGGTTPSGFDCSGFLQYVFHQVGYDIPRLADEQYYLGYSARVSELDVGDLVFFSTYTEGVSHCGIYTGDRNFLHVSSSRGVRIDSLDSDYWSSRFYGARKIID